MARRCFLCGNYDDKETKDDGHGTASSSYFCKSNDKSMSPRNRRKDEHSLKSLLGTMFSLGQFIHNVRISCLISSMFYSEAAARDRTDPCLGKNTVEYTALKLKYNPSRANPTLLIQLRKKWKIKSEFLRDYICQLRSSFIVLNTNLIRLTSSSHPHHGFMRSI